MVETKEALARTDELYTRLRESSKKEIELLEAHIEVLEKSSKKFKAMQVKAETEKADVDKYKTEIDELKAIIVAKDYEMQSFTVNRDKMFQKYESLVQSLREEIERLKREVYEKTFPVSPFFHIS